MMAFGAIPPEVVKTRGVNVPCSTSRTRSPHSLIFSCLVWVDSSSWELNIRMPRRRPQLRADICVARPSRRHGANRHGVVGANGAPHVRCCWSPSTDQPYLRALACKRSCLFRLNFQFLLLKLLDCFRHQFPVPSILLIISSEYCFLQHYVLFDFPCFCNCFSKIVLSCLVVYVLCYHWWMQAGCELDGFAF